MPVAVTVLGVAAALASANVAAVAVQDTSSVPTFPTTVQPVIVAVFKPSYGLSAAVTLAVTGFGLMVKPWSTFAAAFQLVSPACEERIVQVPFATIWTWFPLITVQVPVVSEENET